MFIKVLLVSLFAFVHTIDAAVAPFITKCNKDDSKCIKNSAQAAIPIVAEGIPALQMKPLDPFFMKHLDGSTDDLKLVLSDITGTGLKNCIAKKMQLDLDKSKLFAKLLCSVDFKGQYEMNGRLLFLPIEGKGDAHVILNKVLITADVDMKEVTGANGQKHWKIKSYQHSYELKEKAVIELENLFNGNKVLGRAASDLFKSSPNEVVETVGPPIVSAVVHEIVEDVKKFFLAVPIDELIEN